MLDSVVTTRWMLYGLLAATALLAALTAFAPLVGVGVSVGVVALLITAYFVSRPWRIFALFVFLLPPHVVLMAVLLAQLDLPGPVVKAISAWKEGALFLLLGVVAWRTLRTRWAWKWPDVLVFLYVLLVVVSALLTLAGSPPLGTLLYGIRDALLPVLLYTVGRFFPMSERRARRVFRWLLWAALIFSVIGIVERFLIPTEWHVRLGVVRYFRELLGLYYPDYLMGLPENFWTSSNSGRLRRAVSVYGSSQPFALSFLLLVPVAYYGALSKGLPERGLARLALAASLMGLVLTITRFTIVACLFLLVFAALVYNQQARKWAMVIVAAAGIGFGLLLLTSRDVQLLVVNTITFEDTSSDQRLSIWQETAEVVLRQPYGYGIGVVGQTANRFLSGGGAVVKIEGQYSKIAVELGIEGLLLYGSMLVTIAFFLFRAARQVTTPYLRGLCFAMGLTFVGLTLNSLPTEWHNSPALVYPTWWLAGSCLASTSRRNGASAATKADGSALPPLTKPSPQPLATVT